MATYPEPAKVIFGEVYGPNDNDFTGTYVEVDQSDYGNDGSGYGPNGTLTGGYVVIGGNNVRFGVAFGAGGSGTGQIVVPAVGDVRDGVSVDTVGVGTLVVPPSPFVLTIAGYDTDGAANGTYNATLLIAANVKSGVKFAENNTLTGALASGGGTSGSGFDMQGQLLRQYTITSMASPVQLSNLTGAGSLGASGIAVFAYGGVTLYSLNGTTPAAGSVGGVVGDNQTMQIAMTPGAFNNQSLSNISLSGAGQATVFFLALPRIQREI